MGTPDTSDETSWNCDLDFVNPEGMSDNTCVNYV